MGNYLGENYGKRWGEEHLRARQEIQQCEAYASDDPWRKDGE